jgi:acetyl esterase
MTETPLDRDMLRHFQDLAKLGVEWSPDWPLPRQRQAWAETCRRSAVRRPPRLMVEDLEAGGIPVRIYRPPGEDPKPGVVFAHGGGWTMGCFDTHDDMCAELAELADVVVVPFEYRLAPEHPHPAQVEDALAVLDWMRSSGRALGIDPTRIIGAGDSAGGQVTAGAALALKRAGLKQLRGMVLIYPALGIDTNTRSYVEHAQSATLSRAEMIDCIAALMGPPESGNWQDPTAAPNLATDVTGLPPTFITAAGHDPLHDDAVIFRDKLSAAGVPVVLREEPALAHSYVRARHASQAAMAGFKAIAEAVRHLAHDGSLPG